jgi:hypothetical protein
MFLKKITLGSNGIILCFLILLSVPATSKVFAHDTTHVKILHPTVVTDPSKGVKEYTKWVEFPSAKEPIRKITLLVKFACPDSMRCADWDYSDRIVLKRKGGKNKAALDYTIAHMLTPYGGAFSKTWSFQWQVDVTDFSLLLRDSVEISYIHSGYEENKDRGWKILLDFEIVKASPAAEPIAIHKVYNDNYQYGNAAKNIEEALVPYRFTANTKTTQARLYVLQTGHGMDNAGCGEFCSKYREIWWNNQMISKQDMWKKCGDNPLYPQAGTWVYNRANWCPGYLNQPEILNRSVLQGKENVFDINMQQYVTKDANVNENIFAYIIEYKSPAVKNDVSLENIAVPSLTQIYSRINPACMSPVIAIKNNGAATLTSCVIKYGTAGLGMQEFLWNGKLDFNQSQEIVLPGNMQSKQGMNLFVVELQKPNGKKDEYVADNKQVSSFEAVPVHGKKMIVRLRTNNKPGDNSYAIRNNLGQVVFERRPGSLQKDSLYNDTVSLAPGCYQFELVDTSGNGLEFWAASRDGWGSCKLLNGDGEMIKDFESDFGSSLQYNFQVAEDEAQWSPIVVKASLAAFPTQTRGKVSLDYFSNKLQNPVVQIIADGGNNEVVEEHKYYNMKQAVLNYDLSYRPAQRYYLKVFVDGQLIFTKRIRVGAR